jgi:hypothetical protein
MKEYVLCEFLVPMEDSEMVTKLQNLGNDFIVTGTSIEYDLDNDMGEQEHWYRITGKIYSEFATVIKLQHADLAERMRISYIPESLKDKYRS